MLNIEQEQAVENLSDAIWRLAEQIAYNMMEEVKESLAPSDVENKSELKTKLDDAIGDIVMLLDK